MIRIQVSNVFGEGNEGFLSSVPDVGLNKLIVLSECLNVSWL